jgi:hypothetical protein
VFQIESCQSPYQDWSTLVAWSGKLVVFDDGRLIWMRYADLPEGANPKFTGYLEQRLGIEGVELLRSEVQASGLLREGEQQCDPGEYHVTFFEGAGGSFTAPDSDLVARLTDPASWLPAVAWQDREVRAFVPSRYSVLLAFDPRGDFVDFVAHLPPAASQVMLGTHWGGAQLGNGNLEFNPGSFTTGEAHELVAALDDGNLEQDELTNKYILEYELPYRDSLATIEIAPLLPHELGCCEYSSISQEPWHLTYCRRQRAMPYGVAVTSVAITQLADSWC